jgi:hypothetical protein
VALNGGATVGMTIAGHHRIVEGVKGDWANKVFRDEGIHIRVHRAALQKPRNTSRRLMKFTEDVKEISFDPQKKGKKGEKKNWKRVKPTEKPKKMKKGESQGKRKMLPKKYTINF